MPVAPMNPASVSLEAHDLIRQIRKSSTRPQLRSLLSRLNTLSKMVGDLSTHDRGQYFYVRGVLYSKAGRMDGPWPFSSTETLEDAITFLNAADLIYQQLQRSPRTSYSDRQRMQAVRRDIVHEAMVAYTKLRSWGHVPDIVPDTSILDKRDQRHVARALRWGWALTSRV